MPKDTSGTGAGQTEVGRRQAWRARRPAATDKVHFFAGAAAGVAALAASRRLCFFRRFSFFFIRMPAGFPMTSPESIVDFG